MSPESTDTPPRICPSCGHDMSDHPYDQPRPGPAALWLRRAAMALLPLMALAYLGLVFFSDFNPGFGTGAGGLALLIIGGPSLLLYLISRILPGRRLVICLHCSWNREYPAPHTAGRTA